MADNEDPKNGTDQSYSTGQKVWDTVSDPASYFPFGKEIVSKTRGMLGSGQPDPNDVSQAGAKYAEGINNQTGGEDDQARHDSNETDVVNLARDLPTFGGAKALGSYIGGMYAEPYGGWKYVRKLHESQRALENSVTAEGALRATQATEEAAQRRNELNRAQYEVVHEANLRQKERQEAERRLQILQKRAEDIAQTKINKGNVFASPTGVLGGIMASFMPLFTGDPESGVRIINQAIDRDIKVQQMNLENKKDVYNANRGLYRDYMELTRDDQAARALTEAKMKDIAAQKILEVAARYQSPIVMAQAQQKAALLRRDGTLMAMDVFAKMWREPKLADAALKAFFGDSLQRPTRDTYGQQMTDVETGAPTISSAPSQDTRLERGDIGGSHYQSDVDYIKSGQATEEAPRTIGTGASKNTFTNPEGEVIEANPTFIDDAVEGGKSGGSTMTTGPVVISDQALKEAQAAGIDRVIDAVDTVAAKKMSPAYANAMKHDRIRGEIEKYKMNALKNYYIAHSGGRGDWGKPTMDHKALEKAYNQYLSTDVKDAQASVGDISHAAKDYVAMEHLIADLNRDFDIIAANGEATKRISKLNLLGTKGEELRHVWNQTMVGLNLSPEENRAMEDLYRKYELIKSYYGKEVFNNISQTDHGKLEKMMSGRYDFQQMRVVAQDASRVTQKLVSNAASSGKNHLGKLLWEAQHESMSGQIPYGGRPAHDRNQSPAAKGQIQRTIVANPTTISTAKPGSPSNPIMVIPPQEIK